MKRTTTKLTALTALCLAAGSAFGQTSANGYNFTRIVGTGDAVPGATPGTLFTGFSSDNGNVSNGWLSFNAYFSDGQDRSGIFTARTDGTGLTRIAANNSTLVNGNPIGGFDYPMVSGGTVSFRAGSGNGFYSAPVTGGPITTIVDTTTAIPGGTGNFTRFGEHVRFGTSTLFGAEGANGQRGMYLDQNGSLSRIVDLSTPSLVNPGGATFDVFTEPFASPGAISFDARDTDDTDFLAVDFGSGLSAPVVEGDAVVGGQGGNLTGFDESSVSGSRIAFQGSTTTSGGVYLYDDTTGQVTVVADRGTEIPGGGGALFSFAGNPSIGNGVVAFNGTGTGSTNDGIYLYNIETGEINRLLGGGDKLFGKTVQDAETRFPVSLSGAPEFAMRVTYTEGGFDIVTTSIPEPGSLALLSIGGLLLIRRNTARASQHHRGAI